MVSYDLHCSLDRELVPTVIAHSNIRYNFLQNCLPFHEFFVLCLSRLQFCSKFLFPAQSGQCPESRIKWFSKPRFFLAEKTLHLAPLSSFHETSCRQRCGTSAWRYSFEVFYVISVWIFAVSRVHHSLRFLPDQAWTRLIMDLLMAFSKIYKHVRVACI